MKRHVVAVHEEKKSFKCIICEKGFAQKGKLKIHVATVHEEKKPLKCKICDYKYKVPM